MPTSNSNKGFVEIFILILVLISALAGSFYLFQSKFKAKEASLQVVPTITPTPTPSLWKTYTNSAYKFQVTYPLKGVIHGEKEYFEGECGKAIKGDEPYEPGVVYDKYGDTITFDNLFEIQIDPWSGSIDEYLVNQGAKSVYDINPVASSSAQEAIELIGLKKGAEYAVGYPPLVYIKYIYINDGRIFLVRIPPNHNNPGGCVNPNLVDPVKYAKYVDQGWNFTKNFKFL